MFVLFVRLFASCFVAHKATLLPPYFGINSSVHSFLVSSGHVTVWPWVRSEVKISKSLPPCAPSRQAAVRAAALRAGKEAQGAPPAQRSSGLHQHSAHVRGPAPHLVGLVAKEVDGVKLLHVLQAVGLVPALRGKGGTGCGTWRLPSEQALAQAARPGRPCAKAPRGQERRAGAVHSIAHEAGGRTCGNTSKLIWPPMEYDRLNEANRSLSTSTNFFLRGVAGARG